MTLGLTKTGVVQVKVTTVPTGTVDAEDIFAVSVGFSGLSVTLGLIDNDNLVNHGIDIMIILLIMIEQLMWLELVLI